jgi:hypothetical protein
LGPRQSVKLGAPVAPPVKAVKVPVKTSGRPGPLPPLENVEVGRYRNARGKESEYSGAYPDYNLYTVVASLWR